MRLPRFRIRTMLILVALAGIGMWACLTWWPRYRECSDLAKYYAKVEDTERRGAASLRDLLPATQALIEDVKRERERITTSGEVQLLAGQDFVEARVRDEESHLLGAIANSERTAEWYKLRKEECRRAALCPWLSVPLFELPPVPPLRPSIRSE